MKNFPKPYVDSCAMTDVLRYLYSKSEDYDNERVNWETRLREDPDNEWYMEQIAEASAMASAFQRLADRLGK